MRRLCSSVLAGLVLLCLLFALIGTKAQGDGTHLPEEVLDGVTGDLQPLDDVVRVSNSEPNMTTTYSEVDHAAADPPKAAADASDRTISNSSSPTPTGQPPSDHSPQLVVKPAFSEIKRPVAAIQQPHTPQPNGVPHHLVLFYDEIPADAFCTVEALSALTDTVHVWIKHEQTIPFPVTTHVINTTELFQGTPLLNFEFSGQYAMQNVADALRLAIVYKHGGVYMDCDFLVYQVPGEVLAPGYAKEDDVTTNNAIFRFEAGSPLVAELMRLFVEEYNGDQWGYQGPALFTRVLATWPSPLPHWDTAQVYPYSWRETRIFFQPKRLSLRKVVVVHLWHHISGAIEQPLLCTETYSASWLARQRAAQCPLTLWKMMEHCK